VPTSRESELWDELEERLGEPIPESVRQVFADSGLVTFYRKPEQREAALGRMLELAKSLRRHGLWRAARDTISEANPDAHAGQRDERWDLWRELQEAAGITTKWAPFTVTRVLDETAGPALPSERVEISFDARMPRSVLLGRIRAIWPRLAKEHWIRGTRRPEARAVAYVRHVCLENPPDTPWRQLMTSWNAAHPQWKHRDVRAFRSAFSRAERQLTGEPYGLEWFYSSAARNEELRWRLFDEDELAGNNTELRWAQRYLQHQPGQLEQEAAWMVKMGRFQRRAQELAAQGRTPEEISATLAGEDPEWKESTRHQPGSALVEGLLSKDWMGRLPSPDLGEWKVQRKTDS